MGKESIFRLAWSETTFRGRSKLITSLLLPTLTLSFNAFAGLRTPEQVLLYAACAVAGYALATAAEFGWRLIHRWRIPHKIKSRDDLLDHWQKVIKALHESDAIQHDLREAYLYLEDAWSRQCEATQLTPTEHEFLRVLDETDIVTFQQRFEAAAHESRRRLLCLYRLLDLTLNVPTRRESAST